MKVLKEKIILFSKNYWLILLYWGNRGQKYFDCHSNFEDFNGTTSAVENPVYALLIYIYKVPHSQAE